MTIFFESTYYASLSAQQRNNPIIGYENFVTDASGGAETGRPASNVVNPSIDDSFQSDTAASATLTCNFDSAENIDFIAICGHNLSGSQVTISVDDDVGFGSPVVVLNAQAISSNTPILVLFTQASYQAVRIEVIAADVTPVIAHVMAGKQLRLPEHIYVNHDPTNDALKTKRAVNYSEGGSYLGEIVISQTYESSFSMSNVESDDFDNNIRPFARNIGKPFVFAYRPDGKRDQVSYCSFGRDIRRTNSKPNGSCDFSVSYKAVVEWD